MLWMFITGFGSLLTFGCILFIVIGLLGNLFLPKASTTKSKDKR